MLKTARQGSSPADGLFAVAVNCVLDSTATYTNAEYSVFIVVSVNTVHWIEAHDQWDIPEMMALPSLSEGTYFLLIEVHSM